MGAGVCWALYILFGQKAGADNGVTTAALGVMIAALFVAPIGIVHAGTALLTPSLIPIAIGVAILSTALPYTLEMVALTRMPARTFGTLMSIEPAFGALSGCCSCRSTSRCHNGWRSCALFWLPSGQP
jgi:inner membrane transporter RhtA